MQILIYIYFQIIIHIDTNIHFHIINIHRKKTH